MPSVEKPPATPDSDPAAAPDKGAPAADGNALVPVVGVAASAGGLKAFQELIAHLPIHSGMAFVLIQHLDPKHRSMLTELLARNSPLPVQEIADGMRIEADHIYVIPPNHQLSIIHNSLQFLPQISADQRYRPADVFFSSLADDRGSQAIGVVLSGTASDGTFGCRAIKAAGGTTFAQDSDTAEYDGMPSSAVAAGCIDFVLPPEGIASEIARIARHPMLTAALAPTKGEEPLAATDDQMNKIFILLRSRTGHDFSYYKPTTIKRRISRRMMVNRIDSVSRYITALQKNVAELDALFHDLLINVTAFFRDPEVFEELQRLVLPKLLENRPEKAPIRIWVPACADGQEAFSMAIALHEKLSENGALPQHQVQIFGSDIDEPAIETARRGVYPESAVAELSEVRRKRYFHQVSDGYQINKPLRDMCVFAVQNIIKDPPFSRLDLVSCRNLLIYFNATLQKKVLRLIHYALQPNGYLLLGSSETIGGQADLYAPVSKQSKIYQKKTVAARQYDEMAFRPIGKLPPIERGGSPEPGADFYDLEKQAEQVLLGTYVPPGVIVGSGDAILRFIGRTWPFIEPSSGTASLNLFKNAHPDIVIELRAALHSVARNNGRVRKDNVRLVVDGVERRVDIQVIALGGAIPGEKNLLVMFEPHPVPSETTASDPAGSAGDQGVAHALQGRNEELEREVRSTREYMQSIVEEQEGTNEELRSANEEIQSTNEELQSTNEELETAKEELQSANEELATVNEELETRNQETDRVNSDLVNLLASINIAIVILGADLRVRQFTKPAQKLLNLIEADIGRPIGNIKANIEIPNLENDVLHVIDAMVSKSFELQDHGGHWYSVRLRPYRTLDNRIDGAVVALIDVDEIKNFERTKASLARERRLAAIVRESRDAIVLQDLNGNIKAWNPAAERIYGYTEDEALRMNTRDTLPGAFVPVLQQLFDALRKGGDTPPVQIERIARDGRHIPVRVTASVLVDSHGEPAAFATREKTV